MDGLYLELFDVIGIHVFRSMIWLVHLNICISNHVFRISNEQVFWTFLDFGLLLYLIEFLGTFASQSCVQKTSRPCICWINHLYIYSKPVHNENDAFFFNFKSTWLNVDIHVRHCISSSAVSHKQKFSRIGNEHIVGFKHTCINKYFLEQAPGRSKTYPDVKLTSALLVFI